MNSRLTQRLVQEEEISLKAAPKAFSEYPILISIFSVKLEGIKGIKDFCFLFSCPPDNLMLFQENILVCCWTEAQVN